MEKVLTRRRPFALSLPMVLLASCVAPGSADPAAVPLIGAVATAEYPASVFLRFDSGGRCSGSLVHPRIVVSAWHCAGGPLSVDVTTPSDGTRTYRVANEFLHPGAFVADIEHMALDVAVFVLATEVTGVTPYALGYDGLAGRAGTPLRAVAYGDGSSLFGMRQTNEGVLVCDARRADSTFDFPMLTTMRGAPGDSGGSILDERGELIGVASGMLSGGCIYEGATRFAMAGEIWAARVELSEGLVTAAFESVGATPPRYPGPDAGIDAEVPDSGMDAPIEDARRMDDAPTTDGPAVDAAPGDAGLRLGDAAGDAMPSATEGCSCRSGGPRTPSRSWGLLVVLLCGVAARPRGRSLRWLCPRSSGKQLRGL